MKSLVGTIFGSKRRVHPHTKNAISSPKGDRRSEERIGERQRIRFFSPNCSTAHEGIWINGSDGGAFIETNNTLPLLTVIRIEAPGLVCQARVCRVHWLRPDERMQRSSGMAVQLLSIRDESKAPSNATAKTPSTSTSTDAVIPLVALGVNAS